MENLQAWWLTLVLGILPLFAWAVWSWNEFRFVAALTAHSASGKLPPGNMGLPFIGELLSFVWYFKIVRRPDDFIISKQKRYGEGLGLYRTHLFGSPSIIGCSPAFNKFVLQSHDLFPQKWPSSSLELLGRYSLAAVDGNSHARIRNYVANAVNKPDALKKIAKLVQPQILSSFRSWAEKGKIIAQKEVKKMIFKNIGKYFVSFEPGPLLDTLDQLFSGLVAGVKAQPLNIPGTTYYRAVQCRKKLIAVFRNELEKRKQCGNERSEMNDLMDGMMRMRDEEGNLLRDEEVLDNIVNLVIAGYETTSLASMWAIYYLAKSPDVLQKLREENMAWGKKGDFITYEDVAQLKYTNKVVEEIIRMANISSIIFRTVKEDVVYQGYRIPKGWSILLWVRFLHTDPKNFDSPMNFNPDRWNEQPKPGIYQAFGGGPRICVGNMFARMQVAIFLHHLVTGYKWELINPEAKIAYLPHPKPEDGLEISFSTL